MQYKTTTPEQQACVYEAVLPCTEMHPEAVLIRGIATGPPPPLESGGGVSSWQTDGRTAGVATIAQRSMRMISQRGQPAASSAHAR